MRKACRYFARTDMSGAQRSEISFPSQTIKVRRCESAKVLRATSNPASGVWLYVKASEPSWGKDSNDFPALALSHFHTFIPSHSLIFIQTPFPGRSVMRGTGSG